MIDSPCGFDRDRSNVYNKLNRSTFIGKDPKGRLCVNPSGLFYTTGNFSRACVMR